MRQFMLRTAAACFLERLCGGGELALLAPRQAPVVEPCLQRRFDDLEVGREVEVSRREQTVVADVEDISLERRVSGQILLDPRQDWVLHGLESLGDQRRSKKRFLGSYSIACRKRSLTPINQ